MQLVHKSRAACLSAVETYNRASAMYREETFAILMLNAWELLLKARVMKEAGGKPSALYAKRVRKKKDGTPSKRKEIIRTRSGSPMTIGIDKCWKLVAGYPNDSIDTLGIANIEALMEIRDNATHFVVTDALLRKKLSEISLAAVRNYVIATQQWFGVTFSDLNIASIPLSFDLDQKEVEAVAKKSSTMVSKFLSHMQKVEGALPKDESNFAFSVRVDFDLIKKKDENAVKASMVGSNDADLTVVVEQDNVPPGFTLRYHHLIKILKERYSNFKQNKKFHTIMSSVKSDRKLCYERYLDPSKKQSSKKSFFNPNAIKIFDEEYTKKNATLFEPEPS
ncbi:DUF3644 domain-containing protein [Croceicoccus sp. F390]|uniref:DUF3644 domain-containing protein n=1 Tax=Croceicoccus esteveae TaxID=3075597 RepID=A0ABU2ZKW3_9SPHN|nr:DUF3644 domain-containing protein [Croceicoccus sp. F390]MDT0576693.1 DUF3644 domain-containing protein [Croceicoccus sp. F390]